MTPFPLDEGRAGDGGDQRRHEPGAVARARRPRKALTLPEKRLWADLRRTPLHVRRQAPTGRYVSDFIIHDCKLIEIDGPTHGFPERELADAQRDVWFASQGYRTLRFTNARVMDDIEGVPSDIQAAALSPPSPALPPSRGKGE